jgi:Ca2+-binding RTX toxin-like protein
MTDHKPQVSILLDPEVAVEGGETTTLSFVLDKPAPVGGLEVQFRVTSSDGLPGDGTFPASLFVNVASFKPVEFLPNGDAIFAAMITEGSTFGSVEIAYIKDATTESPEVEPLTLLPSNNYTIDPFNGKATIAILDFPTTATIEGTVGNNILNGTSAAEFIKGLAGNDVINGNGGSDLLEGNEGNDLLTGADSREFINGGKNNDTLYGNGGRDVLVGGSGNDLIHSGSGADQIEGGLGNDTLYVNGGADIVNSGAGFDTVWLGAGRATVTLKTGHGHDTIKGFQLGITQFRVGSLDGLSFADGAKGAQIFQGGDLLATVSQTSAAQLDSNKSSIFVV